MTRARLLFVDDEPEVLEAFGDLLRGDRSRWDVRFASSGAEALDVLATAPFDVVISDMRMPKQDGAQLLAEVRARFPDVIRIVLSGHADRASLMRAVPIAHQFLAKPCDVDTLRTVLARACAARAMLGQSDVRTIIGSLGGLPSPPVMYAELVEIAADPRKGEAEAAGVVERDPAMTAKLLQVANSPLFGARRTIASPRQAVGLIGLDLVLTIVLGVETLSRFANGVNAVSVDALQRSAIACATVAREIAAGHRRGDEAFTAALLRDVGKVVVALAPHDCAAMDHAAIGACLLGLWGLPLPVVEAVAYHHEPRRLVDGDRELVAIVHAADGVCERTEIDLEYLARAGVPDDRAHWRVLRERAFA
jgi:HD-like signal output (HDOD) protein/CheY-like chemotaxis protein